MSNMIDRQAVIDVLHEYFDGMLETDTWSPCDVYGLIEILPSAQPEIIRCKDCKFSHMTNDGRYCKYCDQFTDTDDYGELVEMYFDSNFYCGYAERRTE